MTEITVETHNQLNFPCQQCDCHIHKGDEIIIVDRRHDRTGSYQFPNLKRESEEIQVFCSKTCARDWLQADIESQTRWY